MSYIQDPMAQLRQDLNGLNLLQINPDVAIDLRLESENYGWTFMKKDSDLEKFAKLNEHDIDSAQDQLADMMILDASQIKKAKKKM